MAAVDGLQFWLPEGAAEPVPLLRGGGSGLWCAAWPCDGVQPVLLLLSRWLRLMVCNFGCL
ncbi:MAG: hypothetical protein DU430_05610 [Candidatus Tokpelaia sp.]|nr:MAG: hypothetical protein DU430_05610 [Candidatus Tokpelaia sp.]